MSLTAEQEKECARLKALFLEKAGMTQRKFAVVHGFGTAGNLNQYLQGRRGLTMSAAVKFAAALGVDVGDFSPRLASGFRALGLEKNVEPIKAKMKKIPVISDVQAGLLVNNGLPEVAQTAIENGDFIYVDEELPDGSFAMRVRGDSMEPTFSQGDIVIIDPTISPLPGDFVVAQRIEGSEVESTFKKYRAKGINDAGQNVFELVPLNPDYPTLRSDREQCEIVGVMVEHRRRYRRHR